MHHHLVAVHCVFALAVTGCMHNLSSMPEDHVEVMELDEATVAKHETAAGEGQRQSRASLEDVRVAEPERAEREAPAAEEARPIAGLMAEPSPAPMSRPMEAASAVRGGMAKRSRPAADAVASRPAPPPVVQHVAPAEYLTDYDLVVCPSDATGLDWIEMGTWHFAGDTSLAIDPCRFMDTSYEYLGWGITADQWSRDPYTGNEVADMSNLDWDTINIYANLDFIDGLWERFSAATNDWTVFEVADGADPNAVDQDININDQSF